MGIYNNICHSRSSVSSKSIGIFCAYILPLMDGLMVNVVCVRKEMEFFMFSHQMTPPQCPHSAIDGKSLFQLFCQPAQIWNICPATKFAPGL